MAVNKLFKRLNFDWMLFGAPVILSILSIIELYSLSLGSGRAEDIRNFEKQIFFVAAGIIIYYALTAWFDYRALNNAALPFFIISVLVLILLLIIGKTVRGTTGWFAIGPITIQPIEFVKIAVIVFLARYMSHLAKYLSQLRHLLASSVSILLLVSLILAQPDFGSSVILLGIWFFLVLISGIRFIHLLSLIGMSAGTLIVLWIFVFAPYQKDRILVFLNPASDPLGSGYNVTQAIIGIGSGQLFGKGVSFGSQSQLRFIPEAQTDFIFAVIAEELGLLGVTMVLVMYGTIFWRLYIITKNNRDNFANYILVGTMFLLVIEVLINIGGNMGLIPVTGISLPFLSYGGSSMLASWILLGICSAIHQKTA